MAVGVRPRSGGSAPNGLTTGRAVAVLVVVVGCLAVLWPKIFYPMLMVALRGTDGSESDYPVPMTPAGSMAGRLQQAGKKVPPPHVRMAAPGPQVASKGAAKGSTFNIIMPIYTLGIIILFVYMIFKIMSRGDKDKVDLDRLAYNECSQLGQHAMAARRGGRDGSEAAKGQNNNFEPPKRNRKDPRNAFENNTEMVLKMYGKDKMLDALNVVVNEMHEYKKQAIELAKQLEEQQQQKKKAAAQGPHEHEEARKQDEKVASAGNQDEVDTSDKEEIDGDYEVEENSDAASDDADQDIQEDTGSQNDYLDEDEEDEEEAVPSEAPSEQDSDESDKDIDNQPEDDEYDDEVGKCDEDNDDAADAAAEDTEEVDEVGDDGEVEDVDAETKDRPNQSENGRRTVRGFVDDNEERVDTDANVRYETIETDSERQNGEQVRHQNQTEQSVDDDDGGDYNTKGDGFTSKQERYGRRRPTNEDDQDENDAEIEELFGNETTSNRSPQKKVTANKSVYARHPECLCGTPPQDDDEEAVGVGYEREGHHDEVEPPHPAVFPSASTIDDICRNQEGLQFLDHATEIEPGTKLQCYDDVIYGQCVTERTNESNGNRPPSQNGLQILQELITKERAGEMAQGVPPTNYQQWKSITPEDLFKTASAAVEKADERNANRERNSRRGYRNDDRVNGNYQSSGHSSGGSKPRPSPQNFYYEESTPAAATSAAFEDGGKLRRRTRRARRAD